MANGMNSDQLVVDALLQDIAERDALIKELVDALADVTTENHLQRRRFIRILRVVDDARLAAQRRADQVLAGQALVAA